MPGSVITVVAVAVRFACFFPVANLPRRLSGNLYEHAPKPRYRELTTMNGCGE